VNAAELLLGEAALVGHDRQAARHGIRPPCGGKVQRFKLREILERELAGKE